MALSDLSEISLSTDNGSRQRIDACAAACSSRRDCIILGDAARALSEPLLSLYDQSKNAGKERIANEDLLAAYGFNDRNEECDRDDTQLIDNVFKNKSRDGKECAVSLFDAAIAVGHAAPLDALGMANMHLGIPVEVVGEAKNIGGMRHGVFSEDVTTPSVIFTGTAAETLNSFYGGTIQTMGTRDDRFLLSMQGGGCISFPKP
ncbi:MAG: hypothetical protein OEM85_09490 [Gammaproteobacteria bacterium]|nr:hypothetical protein [Gammaproteobacteria bacterium]